MGLELFAAIISLFSVCLPVMYILVVFCLLFVFLMVFMYLLPSCCCCCYYYYYYYYYCCCYKSKDFSDASQKVAGALYKVTVCAVQVALTVKKSAKAVSHWNDS